MGATAVFRHNNNVKVKTFVTHAKYVIPEYGVAATV